jgi:DNA-binding NarL/FixJ family response regulator
MTPAQIIDQWWEAYGAGHQHRLADAAVRQCLFGLLAHMLEAHTHCVEAASVRQVIDHLLRREAKGQELTTRLTPREREIVAQVAEGHSNREIAEQLFISVGTVKMHLHQVFRKLKIAHRWELIRYAAA